MLKKCSIFAAETFLNTGSVDDVEVFVESTVANNHVQDDYDAHLVLHDVVAVKIALCHDRVDIKLVKSGLCGPIDCLLVGEKCSNNIQLPNVALEYCHHHMWIRLQAFFF